MNFSVACPCPKVHRDLSLENVLMSKTDSAALTYPMYPILVEECVLVLAKAAHLSSRSLTLAWPPQQGPSGLNTISHFLLFGNGFSTSSRAASQELHTREGIVPGNTEVLFVAKLLENPILQAPELHTDQEYDAYLTDAFSLGSAFAGGYPAI